MDAVGQPTPEQVKYKRFGRPVGATNYGGGISYLAQEMKRKGFDWRNEITECYALYKKQLSLKATGLGEAPDRTLLDFWMELLPYITVKVIDKETRMRVRPQRGYKPKISKEALERLTEAEGRKPQ